jgi:hypothetical protein
MTDPSSFTTELAGTNTSQVGRLEVTGLLDFGGALNVVLASGYSPNIGNSFQTVTYGSRSNEFDTIIGGNIDYSAVYAANSLTLIATATAAAAAAYSAPPPSEQSASAAPFDRARPDWAHNLGVRAALSDESLLHLLIPALAANAKRSDNALINELTGESQREIDEAFAQLAEQSRAAALQIAI